MMEGEDMSKILKYSFIVGAVILYYFSNIFTVLLWATGYFLISMLIFVVCSAIFVKILSLTLPGERKEDMWYE